MRTLAELAECYERWAAETEALAAIIVANMNYLAGESQAKQLNQAEALYQEADNLRQQAIRLRVSSRVPTLGQPVHAPDCSRQYFNQ